MPDQTIRPEGPVAPPPRPQTSVWAKIAGPGLAVIGTEITVGVLHPKAAESIAIADAAVPVIAALVLFTVIVRGSEQTVSRVFRLLRWVCNRPEPTAPDSPMSKLAPQPAVPRECKVLSQRCRRQRPVVRVIPPGRREPSRAVPRGRTRPPGR
jgi:hypothetical protein